ncbi:MAG TPA: hypothetical protein DEQ43_08470 [Nocardioides bacterium]|jgi:excisionase family DNA binding protein|nr:hypothetical protein [Nocardioides sp.]
MAWITTTEAALRLGVSEKTLEYWRAKRKGPKFYRANRNLVRYKDDEVDAFLESAAVETDGTR